MQERTLPNYIQRVSEQVFNQPYQTENVNLYTFFVKTEDKSKVQAVLDKFLNERFPNGEYKFEVLAEYMIVCFAGLKIFSQNPPDNTRGWVWETEMIFWIPTLQSRLENGKYVDNDIVFYPYVAFVDNPMSIAAGREVYGFTKEGGRIVMPGNVQESPLNFSAGTVVFDTFNPETQARWAPVLEIKQVGDSKIDTLIKDFETFIGFSVETIRKLLAGHISLSLFINLIQDIKNRSVDLIYLKQFRDVEFPLQACYQSVIKAPVKINGFQSGAILPGPYEISFHNFASQPWKEELGLPEVATAAAAFYIHFQFLFDSGKEIWRFKS